MTASRSARLSAPGEFCTIQPLASVLSIALFLFKITEAPIEGKLPPRQAKSRPLRARISRDQGAFAAGTPREGTYNKAATPATKPRPASWKKNQTKVPPPNLTARQAKIDTP